MTTLSTFPTFRPQAVPDYPPGHARNPIKPYHTPSLMEMLGINPFRDSCKVLQEEMVAAIKASQERRRGVKVKR